MSLAGGVSLLFGIANQGYLYQEGMICFSGRTLPRFRREGARAPFPGPGVGIVVLKRPSMMRLPTVTTFMRLFKGTAVNNDGSL